MLQWQNFMQLSRGSSSWMYIRRFNEGTLGEGGLFISHSVRYLTLFHNNCKLLVDWAWYSKDLHATMLFRYEVGYWVKFKGRIVTPSYGWQGARHKSIGFVQNVLDKDNLIVSFCSVEGREAQVLVDEVVKVIPLDRGQHVKLKPDVKEPRFDIKLLLHCIDSRAMCFVCPFCSLSQARVFWH